MSTYIYCGKTVKIKKHTVVREKTLPIQYTNNM